jgi:hypothetical protein
MFPTSLLLLKSWVLYSLYTTRILPAVLKLSFQGESVVGMCSRSKCFGDKELENITQ